MYPISLNLQGKKCIVFGAGKVAQRRVWGLLDAGAEVTVAAPEKMPACWETARLTYLEQPYAPELLEEQFLVFAATDDSAENARIVPGCPGGRKACLFCNGQSGQHTGFCRPGTPPPTGM